MRDPSGQAPAGASFTNANGQSIDALTSKPSQPPAEGTSAANKAVVHSRTYVELGL